MKNFQEILRVAFISPEFVYILIMVLLARDWLSKLAEILQPSGFVEFSLLAGAPLAILITSYKLGYVLLNPDGKKKILLEWDDYWKLKLRIAFSLVVGVIAFFGMSLGVLVFYFNKEIIFLGFAYAFLGLSAVTVTTISWARIELQDILE